MSLAEKSANKASGTYQMYRRGNETKVYLNGELIETNVLPNTLTVYKAYKDGSFTVSGEVLLCEFPICQWPKCECKKQ